MPTLYKILPAPLWREAERAGRFRGSEVDLRDGFIHFSTAEQVEETAHKHFAGQDDLLLVRVEAAKLGDALKWEPSRGGALFPHLYGDLELSRRRKGRAAAARTGRAPPLSPARTVILHDCCAQIIVGRTGRALVCRGSGAVGAPAWGRLPMRKLFAATTAAALLWSAAAFAADPVGSYSVEGTNPGGKSTYKGTVTVTKTGETFRVIWVVGGTRYIGTGIGDKDFLAVSYKSGQRYRPGALRRRRRQLGRRLDLCRRPPGRRRNLEARIGLDRPRKPAGLSTGRDATRRRRWISTPTAA